MKKCIYLLPPDQRHKKVFVKGHFIENATAIRKLYPQAKFLNMIRTAPAPAQSYANFMYVQPHDLMVGIEVCFEHLAVYAVRLIIFLIGPEIIQKLSTKAASIVNFDFLQKYSTNLHDLGIQTYLQSQLRNIERISSA